MATPPAHQDIPLSQRELRLFQDLVYRHAGIRMTDAKRALIQHRLRARLHARGCDSFAAYHSLVEDRHHRDELQECLNALTTNETFFFRHRQHWDLLAQQVVPQWLATHRPGAVFRFWSAAASSGEEAYSAAMLLDDAFSGASGRRFAIEATDINEAVLARARRGRYGAYAVQKCTPACLDRYFTIDDEHYDLVPKIRSLVSFRRHNLMERAAGEPCDVIFIRNVLIYFDGASKSQVVDNVCQRLRPGGWMVLGGSESLGHSHPVLTYRQPGIYQKAATA